MAAIDLAGGAPRARETTLSATRAATQNSGPRPGRESNIDRARANFAEWPNAVIVQGTVPESLRAGSVGGAGSAHPSLPAGRGAFLLAPKPEELRSRVARRRGRCPDMPCSANPAHFYCSIYRLLCHPRRRDQVTGRLLYSMVQLVVSGRVLIFWQPRDASVRIVIARECIS